jgi:hypothetical protein
MQGHEVQYVIDQTRHWIEQTISVARELGQAIRPMQVARRVPAGLST